MSLLNPATAYRRSTNRPRVPVVLPLVRVDVDEHGLLDVTVDEVPFLGTESVAESRLSRSELRPLLDRIASERGSALRVEIREPDGKVFTDFHTPDPAPVEEASTVDVASPANPENSDEGRATLSAHLRTGEITGAGFGSGEDVAVAVVIYRHPAEADGTVALQLPVALLERHQADVVLVGATSGSVRVTPGTPPEPVREAS